MRGSLIRYALCLLCLLGTATASADTPLPTLDQAEALRASQAVVGNEIGDFLLQDRQGKAVRLSSFRGQPLLVSFIYTGCFQICPGTTRALHKAVSAAQEALGDKRFQVLSIGFNQPADSPVALKAFAAQQGIADANWEFLSPPAAAVAAISRDFGFSFVATPAGFDHTLQVTLVDQRGRIYRQIYGDAFAPEDLIRPLQQLLAGAPTAAESPLENIVERVRLICSVYDPKTGKYRLDWGLLLEIAGGITSVLWTIGFFIGEWRNQRAARRQASA